MIIVKTQEVTRRLLWYDIHRAASAINMIFVVAGVHVIARLIFK